MDDRLTLEELILLHEALIYKLKFLVVFDQPMEMFDDLFALKRKIKRIIEREAQ